MLVFVKAGIKSPMQQIQKGMLTGWIVCPLLRFLVWLGSILTTQGYAKPTLFVRNLESVPMTPKEYGALVLGNAFAILTAILRTTVTTTAEYTL